MQAIIFLSEPIIETLPGNGLSAIFEKYSDVAVQKSRILNSNKEEGLLWFQL